MKYYNTLVCSLMLVFLLLFCNQNFYGQTYQTIYPDRTALFVTSATNMLPYGSIENSLDNYCPNGICALGIKVDSVAQNADATVHYFQKLLRGGGEILCLEDSWLGAKNVVSANGEEQYFNGNGDTLFIETQASIGSEWVLFDDGVELKFKAKVENITETTTWANLDSVKVISIQRIDESGNTLPHIFNGKSFKISKEWGFTEVFDLYHFPMDTTLKSLEGTTNPSNGLQNLVASEIFDYQIGAEFHYHKEYFSDWDFSSKDTFIIDVVIDKTVSSDGNVFTYTIDHTYYAEIFGGMNDPNTTIDFGRDTIQVIIDVSDDSDFNQLPFEAFEPSDNDIGYNRFIYDESDGAWMKVIDRSYYQVNGDDCITEYLGDPYYLSYYKTCLGLTSVTTEGNVSDNVTLVYYKKGDNTTWGTPIDIDLLTSINPIERFNNEALNIYPNPTTDYLYLKNHFNTDELLVQIYDLQGSEVVNQKIKPNSAIDIRLLQSGIHYAKITTKEAIYTSSFLKVN